MVKQSRRREVIKRGGGALVAAGFIAGCSGRGEDATLASGSGNGSPGGVTVGSKNFAESKILGYMAYERLNRNTDLALTDQMGYGPTSEAWSGLTGSDLGMYWEYSGTMLLTHPPQSQETYGTVEESYSNAKEMVESNHDLTVLNNAPFNNSYGMLTTQSWAETTGVETLSDLAAHINGRNTDARIAIGPSFADRLDGWSGLLDYYGFENSAVSAWEDSIFTIQLGLTYARLNNDDVDIAMGFTTDPQIQANNLVLLEDDQSFWPIYSPAPVVANSVIDNNPVVQPQLDAIGPAIGDRETMQKLNGRVDIDGENPQQVATDFLSNEGLI